MYVWFDCESQCELNERVKCIFGRILTSAQGRFSTSRVLSSDVYTEVPRSRIPIDRGRSNNLNRLKLFENSFLLLFWRGVVRITVRKCFRAVSDFVYLSLVCLESHFVFHGSRGWMMFPATWMHLSKMFPASVVNIIICC